MYKGLAISVLGLLSGLIIFSCSGGRMKPLNTEKVYTFNVLALHDGRAGLFSYKEYDYLFSTRMKELAKKYLGYDLRFNFLRAESVMAYYKRNEFITRRYKGYFDAYYFDVFGNTNTDISGYLKGLFEKERDNPLLKYFPMINPSLPDLAQYKRLSSSYVADIKKVLSHSPFGNIPLYDENVPKLYSYIFWKLAASAEKEADLLIVNIPINAGERKPSLETLAERGFHTGFYSKNKFNKFKAVSVVSTYPFLGTDPILLHNRGLLPKGEKKEAFAVYLLHELGHLLARYDDHPALSPCIMQPTLGLNHYRRYESIKAGRDLKEPYRSLKRF